MFLLPSLPPPRLTRAALRRLQALLTLALIWQGTFAQDTPPAGASLADLAEPHHRIAPAVASATTPARLVALTLDACSGRFDGRLMTFLIERRIPATLFVTKRWMQRNPDAITLIRSHADLFDVENHGERHVPAVIGSGRTVYGLPAHANVAGLHRELDEGARAIESAFGRRPTWYRGATALYDRASLHEIEARGYRIAGFSINADSGARLHRVGVTRRLAATRANDVIIGHINHPESDSGPGLIEGLARLQNEGYTFVRLDQVNLVELRKTPRRKPAAPSGTQRSSTSVGVSEREQQGRN